MRGQNSHDVSGVRGRPCWLAGVLLGLGVWVWGAAAGASPARTWTALAYPPAFEHISVEHGLSQSSVHTIAQDKAGFLWMGTDAGLNRYDGFRFLTFHPEKNNPQSLAGDWIEHIVSDRHGTLWISARNAGLTLLEPESLGMVRIPISDGPGGLPARTINALVQDRDGTMWIGTEAEGLWRVDSSWGPPSLPRFEKVPYSTDGEGPVLRRVSTLFIDRAGTLWLASPELGLGRLRSEAESGRRIIEFLPHDVRHRHSPPSTVINTIAEDPFGKIWLGTDLGLLIGDPISGELTRWSSGAFPQGTGRVTDILHDTKDTLWVASDGLGLFRAPPREQRDHAIQLDHFAHDPKDAGSLSRNGLQCVFEDTSGMLWVSAYQGGVNKLILHPGASDRARPSVYQYRNNAADPASLSGDTISAVGEDGFGSLWIGTDGFGLNRLLAPQASNQPGRFERFRKDPTGAPGSLPSDVILTTHLDAQKHLWLGSYMGGLIRVDQDSASSRPRFVSYRHDPENPESLSSDFVRDIVDDGQGGFWIACDAGGGMNHFDPRTGKATRYGMGQGPRGLKSAHLMRMVKDGYGTLWIATQLGLHRYNPDSGEFRVYEPGGPGSPSDAFINTLALEPSGILWIGTRSGGLNRTEVPPWNGPEPRFSSYGTAEGLPAESILSILPDDKGDLWLSTPRALGRFDTRAMKGYPFPFQRGLRRAEFIWNAAYRDRQGEMFFGSNDGLMVFHPDDIVPNPIPPVLAFTGLQVRHRALPLRSRMTASSGIPQIAFAPGESMFSLEFAALHFAAPDQNQYAYRLEGLDQGWNEIGNRHSVSYTGLPPGQYLLSVRASNPDGVGSRDDLKLGIHMLPPWYATWWSQGLLVLGLGLVVYALVRVRMRVLSRHNRQLSKLVDERTRELALANEALRNQSLTDPLTGLRNRRLLDSSMPEWVATVQRQQRAVSGEAVSRMKLNVDLLFIMIDIDHFKQVNDRYGHQAGDRVLQQFGEILRAVTRTTDTVARWGGEEFLIVARNAARADATVPVERIRKAVEDHVFDLGADKSLRCTCSLGFSVFPLFPGDSATFGWEQIIALADTCLYATKQNGRNAWVGIVPLAAPEPGTVIPRLPTELARSPFLTPLTSLHRPIAWPDEPACGPR